MFSVVFLAQVKFVVSPSGIVYIPPTNSSVKTVRCTTNVTANIKWVHSLFNDLDLTTFSIIQENSTSSIMIVYQSLADANTAVLGTLLTGSIVCQAGTTNSTRLSFRQEGEEMFNQHCLFLNTVTCSTVSVSLEPDLLRRRAWFPYNRTTPERVWDHTAYFLHLVSLHVM